MDASNGAQEQTRWCFFGSAALAVHCAAVLLLPDMPPHEATTKASQSTVWMTGSADTLEAAHDTPDQGPTPALSAPSQPVQAVRRTRPKAVHHQSKRPEPVVANEPPSASATTASASSEGRGEPPQAESSARGEGGSAVNPGVGRDGAARADELRHGPGLLTASSPCRGFFPAEATVRSGAVQIAVHVDATGHATLSRLLTELPLGQGFGPAARACAAALRFAPAVNHEGVAVAGEAKLELRFSRS